MVFKKRDSQRSRAAVAVQVLVALPLIFGLAAITVDVGVMYNTRSDMQRAADAAALAAVGVIAEAPDGTNPIPAAAATAADFVTRNAVVGRVLEVDPQTDVQAGRAVYDPIANTYNFTAGQQPLNAVRVTIRHTSSSANGALPLYFASLFGKSATNVTARATAMFADTSYVAADCVDSAQPGLSLMCIYGDSDDSDDSEAGTSDDSDDSDSGHADSGDSDSGDSDSGDSDSNDSDGDSDDSDDSVAGDSDDSDDSDSGDSDGSTNGDSDDSDDSASGASDDSDDSEGVCDSDGARTVLMDAGAIRFWLDHGANIGPCPCETVPCDLTTNRVTLCHIPTSDTGNPQTMTLGDFSAIEHLDHGDAPGVCPGDRNLHFMLID